MGEELEELTACLFEVSLSPSSFYVLSMKMCIEHMFECYYIRMYAIIYHVFGSMPKSTQMHNYSNTCIIIFALEVFIILQDIIYIHVLQYVKLSSIYFALYTCISVK